MRINTNVSSLTAQEAAQNTNKSITGSLEKLSTGSRINKASDDASGLAIADKLRTQATSIKQGIDNGNSAVALLQIADKSMAEQSNILDTVKAKLIQANTDTTSDDGREAIRKDISKLLTQLDNIASQTNYNGKSLLQASSISQDAADELKFQIGETEADIINTLEIQSNTAGLGKVAGGLVGGVVDAGKKVGLEGTGTVTADTETPLDITLSGKVGKIEINNNANIVADARGSQVLQSLLDNGVGGITKEADGSFTIDGGTELDLSSFENIGSMRVTSEKASELSLTDATNASVVNNSAKEMKIVDLTGSGGSLSDLKDITTLDKTDAAHYQEVINQSITELNGYRGEVGSTQNQVESAVRNLMTQATNVKAAESIIRDVDYAAESANFNKQNIISQAGSYAISQANAVQQNVLRLLQ